MDMATSGHDQLQRKDITINSKRSATRATINKGPYWTPVALHCRRIKIRKKNVCNANKIQPQMITILISCHRYIYPVVDKCICRQIMSCSLNCIVSAFAFSIKQNLSDHNFLHSTLSQMNFFSFEFLFWTVHSAFTNNNKENILFFLLNSWSGTQQQTIFHSRNTYT